MEFGEIGPYQNGPLASDEDSAIHDADDEPADNDGLTPSTLEQRFEKRVQLSDWCRCEKCSVEELASALEYRCCTEVNQAAGMMVFDGSADKIKCITDHEDYAALTNTAVLTQVAPLLRGREGQVYRRKNGSSQNE
ncbi:hypothetical protein AC249_AIPGENE13531 [Exaiptasia diaphana]|nr:hypothetical protein AC249_AIPGENE13531 [Exaiptasia diaphana]